jgi:hypothetical protein
MHYIFMKILVAFPNQSTIKTGFQIHEVPPICPI